MSETSLERLESVFRGWQTQGATVAVLCTGPGMRVVFSGKIAAARQGRWTIGNGRAGLVFDLQYASGRIGDPAAVPDAVRECMGATFVRAIDLLLETGDECWFGEVRAAEITPSSA
jgi:hypothetical protein